MAKSLEQLRQLAQERLRRIEELELALELATARAGAAHDAEVAAKAWHEGHEVSCEDVDYICERFHPNPYRKAVQTK